MIRTFKSPPDSPFAIARDGEVYLRSVDWHETSTEGQRQQWRAFLSGHLLGCKASKCVASKTLESVIAAEKEAEQQRVAHDNG